MYTIGQLSKKTGVTVRTLDYYDEIALLKPSATTSGGHRLYDEDDVLRLQQILALKYMGFSLDQIKGILHESTTTWEQSIEQQLMLVRQQSKKLQAIEQALQGVLYSIHFEEQVNWNIIFEIIQLFQRDTDVMRQIYDDFLNEEEQKAIMDLTAENDVDDVKEWKRIIREVRGLLHEDPGSEKAQQLAEQWMERVNEMFGDQERLKEKMWNVIKENTGHITFYPMDKDVVDFIERAIEIMYERQGKYVNHDEKKI